MYQFLYKLSSLSELQKLLRELIYQTYPDSFALTGHNLPWDFSDLSHNLLSIYYRPHTDVPKPVFSLSSSSSWDLTFNLSIISWVIMFTLCIQYYFNDLSWIHPFPFAYGRFSMKRRSPFSWYTSFVVCKSRQCSADSIAQICNKSKYIDTNCLETVLAFFTCVGWVTQWKSAI